MDQLEESLLIRILQNVRETRTRAQMACVCKVTPEHPATNVLEIHRSFFTICKVSVVMLIPWSYNLNIATSRDGESQYVTPGTQ